MISESSSWTATVTVTEAVVFDWMRCAGTEAFKKISKLIR